MVAKGLCKLSVSARWLLSMSRGEQQRGGGSVPGPHHARTLRPWAAFTLGGAPGGAWLCWVRGRRGVMVCPGGGAGVELGLVGAKHVGIPMAWAPVPTHSTAPMGDLKWVPPPLCASVSPPEPWCAVGLAVRAGRAPGGRGSAWASRTGAPWKLVSALPLPPASARLRATVPTHLAGPVGSGVSEAAG